MNTLYSGLWGIPCRARVSSSRSADDDSAGDRDHVAGERWKQVLDEAEQPEQPERGRRVLVPQELEDVMRILEEG